MGQTDRATKERLYEHNFVDQEDAKRSHLLGGKKESSVEREPIGERRSCRNRKKKDYYKAMHNGSRQFPTLGKTT